MTFKEVRNIVCIQLKDEDYVYIMDGNGNIEEKANMHNPTGLPLTAKHENMGQNQRTSSVELDDEFDDICFLEASEDVELADAITNLHSQKNWFVDEIPDELLIDALRKHEVDEVQV
ncbi:UNVERIFIED_CONTAM: hypothetical protein K2H54_054816 [Gekko kuhli]